MLLFKLWRPKFKISLWIALFALMSIGIMLVDLIEQITGGQYTEVLTIVQFIMWLVILAMLGLAVWRVIVTVLPLFANLLHGEEVEVDLSKGENRNSNPIAEFRPAIAYAQEVTTLINLQEHVDKINENSGNAKKLLTDAQVQFDSFEALTTSVVHQIKDYKNEYAMFQATLENLESPDMNLNDIMHIFNRPDYSAISVIYAMAEHEELQEHAKNVTRNQMKGLAEILNGLLMLATSMGYELSNLKSALAAKAVELVAMEGYAQALVLKSRIEETENQILEITRDSQFVNIYGAREARKLLTAANRAIGTNAPQLSNGVYAAIGASND